MCIRDSYKILNLKALDPIEKTISAAEKGSLLHDVFDQFNRKYKKEIPDHAYDDFIQITTSMKDLYGFEESDWNFWLPRLSKISDWFIIHEKQWRQKSNLQLSEAKGKITLNNNFTIEGRVDRIDIIDSNEAAIIDYKTGGTYSGNKIKNGKSPQLALEALITNKGGFDLQTKEIGYLGYWKITGGEPAGKLIDITDNTEIAKIIDQTLEGLTNLVDKFNEEDTPYMAIPRLDNAPRFNDYEHLERVKEWAALDNSIEGSAA